MSECRNRKRMNKRQNLKYEIESNGKYFILLDMWNISTFKNSHHEWCIYAGPNIIRSYIRIFASKNEG